MIMKFIRYIQDADYAFLVNSAHGFYKSVPDETYLIRMFKAKMGYELNLDNPKTYNEKLQWLKIYDRKPIYTTMVDKYRAKEYVAQIIGEQYIIPTLGVWNHFDEIDFEKLPDKFVLKCTHDSGGLIICKDKSSFDIKKARQVINNSLQKNYYFKFREWPYKNVKPQIIAEKFMYSSKEGIGIPIMDYKIYTFNGVARMCMINQDRGIHTKADYFDRDFKWLDFKWGYDHANIQIKKPDQFEKMFKLAEKLAYGCPELRVDFYEVDGQIYFGELTFFDGSGFEKIEPVEWDYKLGNMLDLSKV